MKRAVVTMEPPLNIMKVDPETKFSPMYLSIDENASAAAGTTKIQGEWGSFPGYFLPVLLLEAKRKKMRHTASPANMTKVCM